MARGKMERITRLWQVARHPVSIAILSIVVVLGLASFGCFKVYQYVANTGASGGSFQPTVRLYSQQGAPNSNVFARRIQ